MYNYREAIEDDIREYIDTEINLDEYRGRRDELEEELSEELWAFDGVTGNASRSYFCNAWKAEEALCHNLDLLADALSEFGGGCDILKDGPEACDVTIRCYLLGECVAAVLDEIEANGDFDESDPAHG